MIPVYVLSKAYRYGFRPAPKKFSEYFNRVDAKNLGIKALKTGAKLLKVLDYIQMTQTIYGILPKEPGQSLNVPGPTGTAGIVNLVALTHTAALEGTVLGAAAAPIALVFATADIVVRPMVKGLMADIKEDGKLFLAQAMLLGLPAVERYMQTPSAKISKYDLEENISQSVHEKVMSGQINTYEGLLDAKFESLKLNDNIQTGYVYVYQTIINPNSKDENYIIVYVIQL